MIAYGHDANANVDLASMRPGQNAPDDLPVSDAVFDELAALQ